MADFFDAIAFQFLHGDDQLFRRRKVAHSEGKQFRGLAGVEPAVFIIAAQPFQGIFAEVGEGDFISLATLFAQVVQSDVDGNSREPMLKWGAAIELSQRAPRLDKCLLGQVFEPLVVAFIAVKDGKDARLVAADNFREIVRRAVPNSSQQFSIVAHRCSV